MSDTRRAFVWKALTWSTIAHALLIMMVMVVHGTRGIDIWNNVDFRASAFGVAHAICTKCWPILVPALVSDFLLIYLCLFGRKSVRADDLFLAAVCLFVVALVVPLASQCFANAGMAQAAKPGWAAGRVNFLPLSSKAIIDFPHRFREDLGDHEYVEAAAALVQLWLPYVLLVLIPETWLRSGRSFWKHWRGWVWSSGAVTGAAVGCLVVFTVRLHHAKSVSPRTVYERINVIRQAGDPTTAAELDAFYHIPPEVVDRTAEWEEMLEEPCLVEGRLSRFDVTMSDDKTREHMPDIRQRFAPYLTAVDRLRTLAAQGGYYRRELDFVGSVSGKIPDLDYVYDAAIGLGWDARLRLECGDTERTGQSLLGMINVIELSAFEPLTDSLLTRFSRTSQFVTVLEMVLPNANVSEIDPRSLIKALQDADYEASLERALKAERAVFITLLQEDFPFASSIAERDNELLCILDGYQLAIDMSRRPWSVAYPRLRECELQNRDRLHIPYWGRLMPASQSLPSFSAQQTVVAKCRAYNRLAQLLLSVSMYHQKSGSLPVNLNEAVRGVLREVPQDPFDDQPMRYRLVDEDMCLIWSIGDDGLDNSGQLPDLTVALELSGE